VLFTQGLAHLGLQPVPSHTNFVLACAEDEAQSRAADAELRRAGIIARRMSIAGLQAIVRVNVGSRASFSAVFAALRCAL
jgi:histidinol-phosphate/aromatic aminotransferase/cobyric acid decarboxylase-like protein